MHPAGGAGKPSSLLTCASWKPIAGAVILACFILYGLSKVEQPSSGTSGSTVQPSAAAAYAGAQSNVSADTILRIAESDATSSTVPLVKQCVSEFTFSRYAPSKAELAWTDVLVAQNPMRLCPLISVPPFESWVQTWISGSLAAFADLNAVSSSSTKPRVVEGTLDMLLRAANLPATTSQEAFSVLWFRDSCTGEEVPQFVEPLVGTLRDPRSVCGGWVPPLQHVYPSNDIVTKDHMFLDKAFLARVQHSRALAQRDAKPSSPPPRVIVFDLGASQYVDAPERQSLFWIVEKWLAPAGLRPDVVRAWEKGKTASEFFAGMPDWLHDVTEFLGTATMASGERQNPFVQLEELARPEDFVVIKLDVDFPELENAVVAELLSNEKRRGLVDQFFWEHHNRMEDMGAYWGSLTSGTPRESFDYFRRLREGGVVAHVWP